MKAFSCLAAGIVCALLLVGVLAYGSCFSAENEREIANLKLAQAPSSASPGVEQAERGDTAEPALRAPVRESSSPAAHDSHDLLAEIATPNGSITGRVFDVDTAQGIEGVVITAHGKKGGGSATSEPTDASGSYRIEGLRPSRYEVRRGFTAGYPPADHGEGQVVEVKGGAAISGLDFAVRRGIAIKGKVIDASHQPQEHAMVHCLSGPWTSQHQRTDADGTFSFDIAPQRETFLLAEKNRMCSIPIGLLAPRDDEPDELEVAIHPTGSIAGRVRDDGGMPAEGVYVIAQPVGACMWTEDRMRHAQTDSSGAYHISQLCPATYKIFANVLRRPSLALYGSTAREFARVDLAAGQHVTGLEFSFVSTDTDGWALTQPTSTIAGCVMDSDGNAIARAHVSACGTAQIGLNDTRTDEQGTFRLKGLMGREYGLHVSHDSFAQMNYGPVAVGREDVVIVMAPLGAIAGQVVSADTGTPVASFEVACKEGTRSGNGIWETWSLGPDGRRLSGSSSPPHDFVLVEDQGGRFLLPEIQPKPHTVFVRAKGYALGCANVRKVESGRESTVVIRLERGVGLAGHVVDRDGNPVEGACLDIGALPAAHSYMPSREVLAVTDETGQFVLDTLPPDAGSIWAWKLGFAPESMAVAPNMRDVTIVLSRGGAVRGMVTLDGKPCAGVVLTLESSGQFPSKTANDATSYAIQMRTLSNGAYMSDNVRAGYVRVFSLLGPPGIAPSTFQGVEREALVEDGVVTIVDIELTK